MIHTSKLVQAASGFGQDRVLVARLDSKAVLAVADGAGGRSGGAEAAEIAIAAVSERAHTLQSQADCERLLRKLDTAIRDDAAAGETTCVLTIVTPQQIVGTSVGDSGAWIISPTGVDDLTQNQARKPFLGSGAAVVVGFSRVTFNGTLLLASDGLLKYAAREAIIEAARGAGLESASQRLLTLVRYSSGELPDDVAVVLCRLSQ